jgi:hypothetical protein
LKAQGVDRVAILSRPGTAPTKRITVPWSSTVKTAQALVLLSVISCASAQEFLHDKEPVTASKPQQVPEPAAIFVLSSGAAAAVTAVLRRRKK